MWGSHGVTGLLIRLIIIVTLVTSDADANHLRKRATTDRRKRKCIFNENFPLVRTGCISKAHVFWQDFVLKGSQFIQLVCYVFRLFFFRKKVLKELVSTYQAMTQIEI